jgi:subtilisin family serine protease
LTFRRKLFPNAYEGRAVRIAVLDTGIDGDHPFNGDNPSGGGWARPRRGKNEKELSDLGYKDFVLKTDVEPADPVDQDGHGTHVAGIILQFAPNVHLYVARIAETSKSIGKDDKLPTRVAEVKSPTYQFILQCH